MSTALTYLIAAKHAEIQELERLALTGTLVKVIGRLIHELQRERGLTNLYLGAQGTRFAAERDAQIAVCRRIEKQARQAFEQWNSSSETSPPGHSARLFLRLASVLHALDELPRQRGAISAIELTAAQATGQFNQLIAGLLAVMFEAADSATDNELSRHLVAMFHFTQGKEFAGQERALGSALFASGKTDANHQQQWSHLIDAQARCFKVFVEFSSEAHHKAWQNSLPAGVQTRFDFLRRAGHGATENLDTQLSQEWYQIATQRIDSMQSVEDTLAANLVKLCRSKVATAQSELGDLAKAGRNDPQGSSLPSAVRTLLNQESLSIPVPPTGSPASLGPQLEHSILGMVQEQAHRLQVMSDELASVRAALTERKLIERAKGLLMRHRNLSEDDAFRLLRQTAMSQNRRLAEVAEAFIAMSDLLPNQTGNSKQKPKSRD